MTTIITTIMIVTMIRGTIIPAAIAPILDPPDEDIVVNAINKKYIYLLELKLKWFLYHILI